LLSQSFRGESRLCCAGCPGRKRGAIRHPNTGATGGSRKPCAAQQTGGRGVMHTELDKDTVAKAYARWAPVYDLVFGAVFERGRHAAIAAAERIGGRILEVGVGTGISLP